MAHYFENDDTLKSVIKNIDVLIENLEIKNITGKVLDIGCGYGPIGIYVASMTKANVHMIDINRRSLELARKNVNLNHVNIQIYESNIYENVKEKFDFIITNPPIRVGKEILYKILFDAKKYLNEFGQLWLVINKNQGAKSLIKDLSQEYDVQIITKNKGFYILKCMSKKD